MLRYLNSYIKSDLDKKIILLSGPRQVGKTTLCKMLSNNFDYINFDAAEHRIILKEKAWDRAKDLIIFDELHKLKNWKAWLKGVYDTEGINPKLIVTGSSKLDTYKKAGDSLAGRFFYYKLHPLDLKEIKDYLKPDKIEKSLDLLLKIGGFPEPFISGSLDYYNKWKKTHLDIILKQDLIENESIKNIIEIETMIELLKYKVGSLSSYSSLARDLQCSDKTVKKWLLAIENLFVVFKITPYSKNIARSILKAPKYYFYDIGQLINDEACRFENLLATTINKEIDKQNQCFGKNYTLHYLKNKNGNEIDFLIISNNIPYMAIEAKLSEDKPSKNFDLFSNVLKGAFKIQVVKNLYKEKTYPNGVEIRKASKFLSEFNL